MADTRGNKSTNCGAVTEQLTVTICRCEEITEADVLAAYQAGYHTVDEIKRKLRLGMGPCGGRTCMPLLLSLLARLSGRPIADIAPPVVRPPLKPMPLGMFEPLLPAEGKEGGGQ